MVNQNFEMKLHCPWCGHGFVGVSKGSVGTVSVSCTRCKNVYVVELETGQTKKSKPIRKT
jgi:transcription elongation factor Elf1